MSSWSTVLRGDIVGLVDQTEVSNSILPRDGIQVQFSIIWHRVRESSIWHDPVYMYKHILIKT